ncbi:MAG: cytochrome c biogenesis protein ResB [Syntrophobacteraceae bacterium]
MSKEKDKGFPAKILDSLASLKLTLFVFFTLAAASVVGTLLPQGTGHEELHRQFSHTAASIIETLGLNNLYHSSWFRVLLLLLCVNLLICTVDRLPKTIRLIRKREEPFDSHKLSKFGNSTVILTKMPPDEARALVQSTVSEAFGPLRDVDSSGPYCAVSEKGRWSRLMVYGVHASVIMVLLGALAGSISGFKGFMNLSEGTASSEVALVSGHGFVVLPFKVKCEKFEVSFYDTGAPKEFRSDLTIIEGGKEVLKQSIVVNDPLTYNGITFYQSSYGTTLKEAEIEVTERDTGKKTTLTLPYREFLPIPGTGDQIQVASFQEKMMQFGSALGIVIGKEGQESTSGSWVLAERPDFHGNKIQNYQVRVLRMEKTNYTGLQVNRDPGVWLVYIGFTLMLIGIGMTFYSSHNKIWVCVGPDEKGKGTIVAVAGRTSRNAPGFGDRFEEFGSLLKDRLKPEKIKEEHKKK